MPSTGVTTIEDTRLRLAVQKLALLQHHQTRPTSPLSSRTGGRVELGDWQGQRHPMPSSSQGSSPLWEFGENTAAFQQIDRTTISKDNTAPESSRKAASLAFFASKLPNCHTTSPKVKLRVETVPSHTEKPISPHDPVWPWNSGAELEGVDESAASLPIDYTALQLPLSPFHLEDWIEPRRKHETPKPTPQTPHGYNPGGVHKREQPHKCTFPGCAARFSSKGNLRVCDDVFNR
ncbi:hypothetical protein F4777DRAFT_563912 [Nemania sp. FL0916]|nr:hypothetical protein F4777DRAFT_563912 [Nemania sp. FL0916]